MSVSDAVAELRRAHALLTDALTATVHAEKAIDDGTTTFDTATTGSTQPAVDSARHCALAATGDLRAARTALLAAQRVFDAYCHQIAGHGITDDTTIGNQPTRHPEPPPHGTARPTDHPDTPAVRYAAEISELQRGGAKISPDRVVRVARRQHGHRVWMELGDKATSGRSHILRPGRRDEFAEAGISSEEIIDLVFTCIEGEVMGRQVQGC